MKQTSLFALISIILFSCNNSAGKGRQISKLSHGLIDSIGNSDTLHINYYTEGCFHNVAEEIKIYRKSDKLFAEFSYLNLYNLDFQSLTHELNYKSILAYADFEKKGKTLKTHDGCTTQEQFIIKLKNRSIKFEDNGCEFNGYSSFKIKLFGEAKLDTFYNKIMNNSR